MTVLNTLRAFAGAVTSRVEANLADLVPAETLGETGPPLTVRKAFYEKTQLERVIASPFSATISQQFAKLDEREMPERPMKIYRLGPSIVAGGRVFTANGRYFASPEPPGLRLLQAFSNRLGPVALANSSQGLKYFGHWLRDDCSAYEALRDLDAGEILSLKRPSWPDATPYEEAFRQTWREVDAFRTPSLTMAQDLGFSRDKRARIQSLRARLRKASASPNAGHVVYLKRGPTGRYRRVVNEDQLIERLASVGVKIVSSEAGDARLFEHLLDARILITVEGSQAGHGVYTLDEGGGLLVLQPPDRFYNPHLDWTRLLDNPYGIVVGTPQAPDFHIDPDEVLAMIERMDNAIG